MLHFSMSENVHLYATTVLAIAVSIAAFIHWKTRKSVKKAPITLEDDTTKYALPLIEKVVVSHDVRRFRFRLPTDEHVLGLPSGQHVYLSARVNGKLIVRPYSPISSDEDAGFVDLMVKVYFAGVNPRFPEGGKMSQYLDKLAIGDTVDFRGPTGHIVYRGGGNFAVRHDKKIPATIHSYNRVSMVAGGSGITPILQIILHMLKNPEDNTRVNLLYANRTVNDILCRENLDRLAAEHPDQFKVWYTVSSQPTDWKYSTGRINKEMLETHLFAPSSDSVVLLCGPPAMLTQACHPNLDVIGHQPSNILVF